MQNDWNSGHVINISMQLPNLWAELAAAGDFQTRRIMCEVLTKFKWIVPLKNVSGNVQVLNLQNCLPHQNDVIMSAMAFQITGVSMVCSTVFWSADQKRHQSIASLAFARGIYRWPVNSPHKGQVTQKMFPLMTSSCKRREQTRLNQH